VRWDTERTKGSTPQDHGTREYFESLRRAQPEFVKLSKEIDKRSSDLGKEFEPRLQVVIEEAFGRRSSTSGEHQFTAARRHRA
jgi:hypothetical protein